MPIPAAAGLIASTVHLFNGIPVPAWWVAIPWVLMVALCGFLMVSTWRFWSGKEINFSRSHPFQVLVLVAIVMYVLIRYSNVVMFGIGLTYMFSGIGARAAYGWSRRRRRRPIETSAVLQDAPQEEEAEKRDPPRFQ
jgi:CDP-diacylglycerol--serine O-phosphatidyltransferase